MANLAFEGLVGGLQRRLPGVVEQSPQGLPRKVGVITDRDNPADDAAAHHTWAVRS